MKTILTSLALLVLVSRGSAEEKTPEPKLSDAEKAVLDLTNKEREQQKLPPLKPNPLLFKAAREHSENMARQQKLAHVLDGKQPHQRVADTGYRGGWVGENCAAGSNPYPPAEVLKDWMSSEGHRGNILGQNYTEIGIGIARGKDGQLYYTQVFARPSRR